MTGQPEYRDADWLREHYVEQEKTTSEISDFCGCSPSTISNWLKKHGIGTRTNDTRVTDERLTDREWLREQYVEQKKSTTEIGEECACNGSTVSKWLNKHDIDARSNPKLPDRRLTDPEWLRKQYVEKERTTTEIAELSECHASTVGKWLNKHGIETRTNDTRLPDERLTDKEWLREQYVEQGKKTTEIGDICGCSGTTVSKYLNKHEIETRSGPSPLPDQRLKDRDWLHKQYVEKEWGTIKIAEECGCHNTTVGRWLKKHDIKTRPAGSQIPDERLKNRQWLYKKYVEEGENSHHIAKECGCSRSAVCEWLHRHDIETETPDVRVADDRLKNAEWLREQYIKQGKSTYEIGGECGCGNSCVSDWLHKHGIETRTAEAYIADERLTDARWMRERYIRDEKTTIEIAEECGCSDTTVSKWLDKHGIETRDNPKLPDKRLTDFDWLHERYIEKEQSTGEIAEECGCSHNCVSTWLQQHDIETRTADVQLPDQRLTDSEWLREHYVGQKQSVYDIAAECGCCKTTVRNYLKKHDIETRPGVSGLSGEDHPLWNGGRLPYGKGWNESKRRAVRKRDNHTCQDPRCSVTQAQHLDKHGQKLHVHHLRKARDVDDPEERNAKENLITLCRDCHKRWEKIADTGLVPQVVQQSAD